MSPVFALDQGKARQLGPESFKSEKRAATVLRGELGAVAWDSIRGDRVLHR